MLNCFFGAELKPDGVAVNFTVPKGSTLVITQCAVTSVVPPPRPADASAPAATAAYQPVTLCVQAHGVPTRFAVCTLSPAQQITYCPMQLIFTKPVSFALVPQTVAAAASSSSPSSSAAAGAPAQPLRHVGKKAQREQKVASGAEAKGVVGGGAAMVYPTVHLTGYYEQDADDDEDEGNMAMEVMEGSDEEGDFSESD